MENKNASAPAVFVIRFFYDISGHVSVCSRHFFANDGTARQKWPAEKFTGTREQAETYVAKIRAEWFGGVVGQITPVTA